MGWAIDSATIPPLPTGRGSKRAGSVVDRSEARRAGERQKSRGSVSNWMAGDRRYPAWITLALILGNFVVFFNTVDPELSIREEVAHDEGFVPSRFFSGQGFPTILTHMFLHANLSHLLSNMIALLFLGYALERRIGNLQFLGVYLACGVLAALAFGLLNTASPVPSVGASGAIFGIMGTLTLLYPLSFVFIFIIPVPVVLVAIFYAFTTISFIQMGDAGPVAHFAHLAGMVTGMFIAFLMKPEDALKGMAIFVMVFVAIVVAIQII